jgi:hypothetical protein
MDGFLAAFDRLNRFIGNILLQIFLLLKIEPTAIRLYRILEDI